MLHPGADLHGDQKVVQARNTPGRCETLQTGARALCEYGTFPGEGTSREEFKTG